MFHVFECDECDSPIIEDGDERKCPCGYSDAYLDADSNGYFWVRH